MTYTTISSTGRKYEACSIEGALSQAATMIYLSDKAKAQARADLNDGKTATISYGFKTVTISPTK